MAGLLDRERIIAKPGFNRWLIPPCALATHLCIGQAYALSVFNLPLSKQLGVAKSVAEDWKLSEIGWIFTIAIFVLGASAALFLTMYGGGFATIPAYLADVFGAKYVGAVHGRLLTAWSVAGVVGPMLVNYIREFQIDHGVPKFQAYNVTMYIMAGLLVIAFFANLAVKAVAEQHVEPAGATS